MKIEGSYKKENIKPKYKLTRTIFIYVQPNRLK